MNLYENNSFLNPTYAAHESFVTNIKQQECGMVHEYHISERCNFVQETPECSDITNHLDYMYFLFCFCQTNLAHNIGIIVICIWCCYLFCILGTTADKFFCPALTVISKELRMNENLAGVTIVAFGNGSPDIFTAIANTNSDSELMYSELLGAAMFIIAFVSATIIIVKPFRVNGQNFITDCLFFIAAVISIYVCIDDGFYSLPEAIFTVSIYVIYLIVVFGSHLLLKWENKKILENKASSVYDSSSGHSHLNEPTILQIRRSNLYLLSDVDIIQNRRPSAEFLDHFPAQKSMLWSLFLKAVNPIDMSDWEEGHFLSKIFCIIKSPFIFFLHLVIPIVDYSIEMHGWCKLLNIIHCFTLPIFGLLATGTITITFYGIPIAVIILILSLIAALFVVYTSEVISPPKYHIVFAVASFVGCVLVIFKVANEVVSVLETFGVVSDLTHSMLGLSVLAVGNSIGDLISNVALARQGYQRMAFAACFGGPMLNSLLGIGITFITKCTKHPNVTQNARTGQFGLNCTIFLLTALIFLLSAVITTKFLARRSIGIAMIAIYIIFLIFAILGEFSLIHPYGTDHRDEGEYSL